MGDTVNDESLVGLSASVFVSGGLRDEVPELINIDGWAVLSVLMESEDSDSFLTKVSRMVLEHIDSLVMFTTGITSSGMMFSVFADSSVAHRNMSSKFSGLFQVSSHGL